MPVISNSVLKHLEAFMCPGCGASLRISDGRPHCTACGQSYASEDGIPLLFWPSEGGRGHDVTEVVKAFYEETPFPNYDDLDSPDRLREKAEQGLFAQHLNEQIPHGAKILECGCGTGQLSNFLGLTWGRAVFATDVCLRNL